MRISSFILLGCALFFFACNGNSSSPTDPSDELDDEGTWKVVAFQDTLLLRYFEDENDNRFAFSGLELFRDEGNGSFEIIPETINRTGLSFEPESNTLISVQDSSILFSVDAGNSFSTVPVDNFRIASFAYSDNRFIFSDLQKGIYLIENVTSTVGEVSVQLLSEETDSRVISIVGDQLFVKVGFSIQIADLNQETPSFSATGLPTTTINDIHANESGKLFAATKRQRLLISDDGGESWIGSYPEPLIVNEITDVLFDSNDRIYISILGGGVFYSDTEGGSWTSLSATNFDWQVYDLELIDNRLYASTSTGLYEYDF